MLRDIVFTKESCVWFFLAALTGLSWMLGDGYGDYELSQYKYITVGIFIVAFFKIRLVIMHFMEIGNAPLAFRLVFEAWVALVCSLLIGLYLFPLAA